MPRSQWNQTKKNWYGSVHGVADEGTHLSQARFSEEFGNLQEYKLREFSECVQHYWKLIMEHSGEILNVRRLEYLFITAVKTTPQKTHFAMWNMQEFGIQIELTMTGHNWTATSRKTELCIWYCICMVKCSWWMKPYCWTLRRPTPMTTWKPRSRETTRSTTWTRERARCVAVFVVLVLCCHTHLLHTSHGSRCSSVCLIPSHGHRRALSERSLWLPWPLHHLPLPSLILHYPPFNFPDSQRRTSSSIRSPWPSNGSPSNGSSRTSITMMAQSVRCFLTHTENKSITPSEKACLLVSRRRQCPIERGNPLMKSWQKATIERSNPLLKQVKNETCTD